MMKKFSLAIQLGIAFLLITLIITSMILIINTKLQENLVAATKIEKIRIPAAEYTAVLEIGIYNALADLRGYILLGDEILKYNRKEAWKTEIDIAIKKLNKISINWADNEIEKFELIKKNIKKLRISQEKIEKIARTENSTPSRKILINQIRPLKEEMGEYIIELIDIETKLDFSEKRKTLFVSLNSFESSMAKSLSYINTFVFTGNQSYINNFNHEWKINQRSFLSIKENISILSDDQKRIFKELVRVRKEFTKLPSKVFEIGLSNKSNLANYWLKTETMPVVLIILDDLKDLVSKEEKHLEDDFLHLEENIKHVLSTSWLLFLIGISLIILLGFYIVRSITSAVRSVVDIAVRIGEGNQTEQVSLTGSLEMITLGNSLNIMNDKIIQAQSQQVEEGDSLNKAIIDASYDSVITITRQGLILSFNSTTQDMFLYDFEELVEKNINTIIHTSSEDLIEFLNKQSKLKSLYLEEFEGINKDGLRFPIYMSVSQAKRRKEEIFVLYVKDISEQKKYEEELKDNNKYLTEQNWLRENTTQIMALTQGAIDLNKMLDDLISILCQTLEAGHGVIYIKKNEDDLELCGSYAFKKRKNVSGVIKVGEGLVGQCAKEEKSIVLTSVPTDYIQISSSLGEQIPYNITVIPVLFENSLIGVIEIASFKEFSPLQEDLVEKITTGLGIVINNINNSTKTNLLLEETQRQSEELQAQQEELRATNENLEEQTEQLKKSGSILKIQKKELKDSNEQLAEKTTSLEVQKKEIEDAQKDLEQKSEDLALASKYKSEFLANMSHELRTPLNSYLLLSKSLLDNKDGNLTKEQLSDINVIYEGGGELLHLINDIMDLSKVEAGKLTTYIEDVELIDVCTNLTNLFNPNAKNKNLEYKAYCEDDLPLFIETDSQRLEQILKNFLSNSFKFTVNGNVELKIHRPNKETKFQLNHLSCDNSIAFSVTDTGIGISLDKQKEIFEAFQQEDGSTSRKYGGTGLGLAISKELSKKLGGEIQLISEKDKGSTFTLYLPLENKKLIKEKEDELNADIKELIKDEKENITEEKEDTLEEKLESEFLYEEKVNDDREHLKKEENSILIIDDDEKFSKILLNIVRSHGFKAIVANDGKNGLYLALEYQPNGIFLDLGLPDMDGNKVLEQLKFHDNTSNIPVHVISGREKEDSSINNETISYLKKPAAKKDIDIVINKIGKIESKHMEKALIIDPNKDSQELISELLKNDNIESKCVEKGSIGIKNILEEKFDFVVLDIELPDMTGFELLEQVSKSENTRLPHIIIYTHNQLDTEQRHELQKYSATVIEKDSETTNKQLDEVLLFLQSMNTNDLLSAKKTIYNLDDETNLLKQRHILLVDDDMRNTFALSKSLQNAGLIVFEADNGQNAINKLQEQKDIELVLMDIMMPIMDGYEAMEKIRSMSEYKDIPIIALTAKAMPQDRIKCIEAGASDYLTKPVNIDKLISMLKVWLFKK